MVLGWPGAAPPQALHAGSSPPHSAPVQVQTMWVCTDVSFLGRGPVAFTDFLTSPVMQGRAKNTPRHKEGCVRLVSEQKHTPPQVPTFPHGSPSGLGRPPRWFQPLAFKAPDFGPRSWLRREKVPGMAQKQGTRTRFEYQILQITVTSGRRKQCFHTALPPSGPRAWASLESLPREVMVPAQLPWHRPWRGPPTRALEPSTSWGWEELRRQSAFVFPEITALDF